MSDVWVLAILPILAVTALVLLLLRRRRRAVLRRRHLAELRAEGRLPDEVKSALRRASDGARTND